MSEERRLTRGEVAVRLLAAVATLVAGIAALVVAILLIGGILG